VRGLSQVSKVGRLERGKSDRARRSWKAHLIRSARCGLGEADAQVCHALFGVDYLEQGQTHSYAGCPGTGGPRAGAGCLAAPAGGGEGGVRLSPVAAASRRATAHTGAGPQSRVAPISGPSRGSRRRLRPTAPSRSVAEICACKCPTQRVPLRIAARLGGCAAMQKAAASPTGTGDRAAQLGGAGTCMASRSGSNLMRTRRRGREKIL